MEELNVLGISGSLRQASYNTALLRAATELAPKGMRIQIADIGAIPAYDEDLRTRGLPESVATLRRQASDANAILIATPEYNYSVPGVLKNAIDWLSRPPEPPLFDKALAIMGASAGMSGTMRAQYHLRQIAVFLNMHVVNKPEVFVAHAAERFDADGRLTDAGTRKIIAALLDSLAGFSRRLAAK